MKVIYLLNYFYSLLYFFPLPFSPLIAPAITTLLSVSMSPFAFLLNSFMMRPLSPSLAVILLSIYASVPIFLRSSVSSLDSTYEWNHIIVSFSDWLISLSIMFSRSIHTVAKGKILFFFLCPKSIPLCKCPIVDLSTHLLMDIWAASICWWL